MARSGAGGGAGGGLIVIHAFGDISLSAGSRVVANGGQGGEVTGADDAGSGGGGGGGSIKMFAGGEVYIESLVGASSGGPGANASFGGRGRKRF